MQNAGCNEAHKRRKDLAIIAVSTLTNTEFVEIKINTSFWDEHTNNLIMTYDVYTRQDYVSRIAVTVVE